jgi:hypothetical protein
MGKIFFLLLVCLSSKLFGQDSLSVTFNKKKFKTNDSIEMVIQLHNYTEYTNAVSAFVEIKHTKLTTKYNYRFALLEGFVRVKFAVSDAILSGDYTFTTTISPEFLNLKGSVKGLSKNSTQLNYLLINKQNEKIVNSTNLLPNNQFKIGKVITTEPDLLLVFTSKDKNERKNIKVQLQNKLDSSFIPIDSVSHLISIDGVFTEKYIIKNPADIVVTGKSQKVKKYEAQYVNDIFKTNDAIELDGLNSDEISAQYDLQNYVYNSTPGFKLENINTNLTNSDEFTTSTTSLTYRGYPVTYFVDNMAVAEFPFYLQPQDVALIKVYRVQNSGPLLLTGGKPFGAAVAFFTKRGEFDDNKAKGRNVFKIIGYNKNILSWE